MYYFYCPNCQKEESGNSVPLKLTQAYIGTIQKSENKTIMQAYCSNCEDKGAYIVRDYISKDIIELVKTVSKGDKNN